MVAAGIGESLQYEDAATFAADISIGIGEGPAAPRRREHVRPADRCLKLRGKYEIHTTGDRQIAFPGPQPLAGKVHGHKGRGAGGVNDHRGALETEKVREPTGKSVGRIACRVIRIEGALVGGGQQQFRVVSRGHADVHGSG